MNKMIKTGILVLMVMIIAICAIWYFNQTHMETTFYGADQAKAPQNPSRGYYVQLDSSEPGRLETIEESVSLCLLAYDLYPYRRAEIPGQKIEELEAFLQEAQRRNIKCIFRAAYGFDQKTANDADSKERIASHLGQIAPILNRYKGQIYCVQAGFLGPWGEWHSSVWLEDEQAGKENRNWLLALLLDQLDEELVVNVRRLRFIRDAWEAGLSPERIGFHNDGLLATETDYGTYDDPGYDRQAELAWSQQHLKLTQNGGEMPQLNPYSESDNALREFHQLNLSYLNLMYNVDVLESWKKDQIQGEDAYAYISKRLGYRYYVSQVDYPKSPRTGILGIGQKLKISLGNQGFAPIDKRYMLEIILNKQDGQALVCHSLDELGSLEVDGQISIEIPIKQLKGYSYKEVGIRISEKEDKVKDAPNCVELVNQQSLYKDGVNYF